MDPRLAWAAGLFEGEGCISTYTHSSKYKDKVYKNARSSLHLVMTDKDVMDRFCEIVGCGKVLPRKKQQDHWKQSYFWTTSKRSEVSRILTSLLPFFGNRRAYKALNALDQLDNL